MGVQLLTKGVFCCVPIQGSTLFITMTVQEIQKFCIHDITNHLIKKPSLYQKLTLRKLIW